MSPKTTPEPFFRSEKGASVVLMPVSSRKQLFDLSDDIATKVTVVFYNDAREAFVKAISD